MKNEHLFAIAAGFAGLAGFLYGEKRANQADTVCRKIGKSLDEVVKMDRVDIPMAMIEASVQRSSDNAVNSWASSIGKRAFQEVDTRVANEVNSAVTKAYSTIEKKLEDRVDRCIAWWDDKALKQRIHDSIVDRASKSFEGMVAEAKDATIDKFKDRLDDIADDFDERVKDADYIRRYLERRIGR